MEVTTNVPYRCDVELTTLSGQDWHEAAESDASKAAVARAHEKIVKAQHQSLATATLMESLKTWH